MPVIFDCKCTKCGHEEPDVLLKDSSAEVPNCPMCSEPMDKLFTGIQTKRPDKHHRPLPDNYRFSRGANFGKLSDL